MLHKWTYRITGKLRAKPGLPALAIRLPEYAGYHTNSVHYDVIAARGWICGSLVPDVLILQTVNSET